jgi:hypothetical protein
LFEDCSHTNYPWDTPTDKNLGVSSLSLFFYVWNGMLCTKYIFVFSLENSFPIVLSGEV